jgi:hypothetical protein
MQEFVRAIVRTFSIVVLAVLSGCPQRPSTQVTHYPPDDAALAYKLACGEASLWEGISAKDRAAYERVKRKLNERTDREADSFWDAQQRRSQLPPIDRSIIRPEFQHWSDEQIRRDTADWLRRNFGHATADDLKGLIPAGD